MPKERLQKVLARAGVASRRAAEELILKGRVSVDGRLVQELGTKVDARAARVRVDGRTVSAEPLLYVVLNKPRGVVSTLRDPGGRKTISDLLAGVGARVAPVGRLDFHTSGVLLCTNDGELASRLLHPRHGVEKEYVAKVRGVVDEAGLERLQKSITVEGRATRPAEVRRLRIEGDKTWLSITLREGKNRQVRRLGEAAGFSVLRLSRISQAGIGAEGLAPGRWRYLTRDELLSLKRAYGVPRRLHPPPPPQERRRETPRRTRAPSRSRVPVSASRRGRRR